MPLIHTGHFGWRVLTALFAVTISTLLLAASAPAATTQLTPANPSVVIDPGHGGAYPGAVYGGAREADLNLQISRRLAAELERRGIGASLVRTSDRTMRPANPIPTWRWDSTERIFRYRVWGGREDSPLRRDLQARVNIGNKSGADVFVSIHNNAATATSANGAEMFWTPEDALAQQLARDIQNGVVARTGARNRGVKADEFYVLRWSNQPAVLVEGGFMSNPAELARLRTASYQQRLAAGIADGIERFFRRPVSESIVRHWGGNRYATAASLVEARYQAADTVVLTSGEVFSDSLVAAPLAAKYDAPVLITTGTGLHPLTEAEILRLRPEQIIVVGGARSVSDVVLQAAARAAGIDPADSERVRRIAGPDRFSTSLAVAEALEASAAAGVVVASGLHFADALSVAASAAASGQPILLTSGTALNASVRTYIQNGGSQRPVTVIGGAQVIPDRVMAGLTFERLSGADRFETNWRVITARYTAAQRLRPVFVSGAAFPDALVAGPWAAREGRPLVLIGGTALSDEFRPWYYANHRRVTDPVVVGGPASVSAYLQAMLTKMEME